MRPEKARACAPKNARRAVKRQIKNNRNNKKAPGRGERNVKKALKPGGQLICEFGGAGNIAVVEQAFNRACEEMGLAVRAPGFNFPTPEEFSARLAHHGLTPVNVYDYDRPTPLKDGEQGLANWMRQFFAGQLEALPEQTGQVLLARAEELARPELWDGDHWTADYRRLRAVARKPAE